ncbi:MAG: hypothetical protein QM820_42400 [Minicystis sp.]
MPAPAVAMRSAATPRTTSALFTAFARSRESRWAAASEPTASVCPSIRISTDGCSFSTAATASRLARDAAVGRAPALSKTTSSRMKRRDGSPERSMNSDSS